MTKGKIHRAVTVRLRHGDALDRLREFPNSVVGAIICDPPYD